MKIDIYDKAGKKVKDLVLDKDIFWIEVNTWLMHEYLQYQLNNWRYNLASTLRKWEVRWWWKKPYRQKWTWRARQWSTRNPHYKWWWVAHWPLANRNFGAMMNKMARRKALFCYLSSKAEWGHVFWLDKYDWKISTKMFSNTVKALPWERSVLIVLSEPQEVIQMSARNIPWVKVILSSYLNPVDLTKHEKLCFVWDSLDKVKEIFKDDNKK